MKCLYQVSGRVMLSYGYRCWLFPWLFYSILELFQKWYILLFILSHISQSCFAYNLDLCRSMGVSLATYETVLCVSFLCEVVGFLIVCILLWTKICRISVDLFILLQRQYSIITYDVDGLTLTRIEPAPWKKPLFFPS